MKNFSIACAVMNRENMLKVSLQSWLTDENIKDISIVDWSSKKNLKYLENIDNRIHVYREEGHTFFNISKAFNLAIKKCKEQIVIKMDVDYILNPYYSLTNDIKITEKEFYCGDWRLGKRDNNAGFLTYTNGLIITYKNNIINCGGYNESLEGYGYDDNEIQNRLQKIGIKRKVLPLDKTLYIYHNPHPDKNRTENYKNKTTKANRDNNERKVRNAR